MPSNFGIAFLPHKVTVPGSPGMGRRSETGKVRRPTFIMNQLDLLGKVMDEIPLAPSSLQEVGAFCFVGLISEPEPDRIGIIRKSTTHAKKECCFQLERRERFRSFLDRSFVGRLIDDAFLNDLPATVDPCGENGEYHSFVFDGPIFKKQIDFKLGEIVHRKYRPSQQDGNSGYHGNNHGTNPFHGGFWYRDLLSVS